LATSRHNNSITYIAQSGVIINIILILLSIVFAKERVLFLDSAIYLFEIVNTESFHVPYRRFVNVFNQFLPLIGVKLHLKMNVLFFLYSLNIQLLHSVLFLIVAFGLKQRGFALAIPLIQILLCYESFYLPISELAIGISFLVVLIATLRSKDQLNPITFKSVIALLSVIIIFSHPIMVLPISFMLLWSLIDHKKEDELFSAERLLWIVLILIIIAQTFLFRQVYESERTFDLMNSITQMGRYELGTSFHAITKYFRKYNT